MPTEPNTRPTICSFPSCGRKIHARGFCKGHHKQILRGWDVQTLLADRDQEAYFWGRVDRPTEQGRCWPWAASCSADGYGKILWHGRHARAHRVAYTLAVGPIADGLLVLHRCDNPPCCNPAHLFLGTNADNNTDMCAKGRNATGDRNGSRLHPEHRPRGERVHGAKLTVDNVVDIRALAASHVPQFRIAVMYGVSRSLVGRVVRRETWAHVKPSVSPA